MSLYKVVSDLEKLLFRELSAMKIVKKFPNWRVR